MNGSYFQKAKQIFDSYLGGSGTLPSLPCLCTILLDCLNASVRFKCAFFVALQLNGEPQSPLYLEASSFLSLGTSLSPVVPRKLLRLPFETTCRLCQPSALPPALLLLSDALVLIFCISRTSSFNDYCSLQSNFSHKFC